MNIHVHFRPSVEIRPTRYTGIRPQEMAERMHAERAQELSGGEPIGNKWRQCGAGEMSSIVHLRECAHYSANEMRLMEMYGMPCGKCYRCQCGLTDTCPNRRPFTATCKCDACKVRDNQPSKMHTARLDWYSCEPDGGWREYGSSGPYFGVELETDEQSYTVADKYGYSLSDFICSAALPKYVWPVHASDGSVTGPEFKSHPLSLARWRKHERSVRMMFRRIVHAGYRSHNGGHAGLHINVGKSAFEDADHIVRLWTFGERSMREMLVMSRRGPNGTHYAEFGCADEASVRSSFTGTGYRSMDKYSWLHVVYDEPRVEFRLPRGTLRWDRFIGSVEWLAAMVEFSRHASLRMMHWRMFHAWVEAHSTEYPTLWAMMKEYAL